MNTKKCASCGRTLFSAATICPNCGSAVEAATAPKRNKTTAKHRKFFVAVIIGIPLLIFVSYQIVAAKHERERAAAFAAREAAFNKRNAENCKASPAVLFPAGKTFESKDISALQDKNFNKIEYFPNLSFRINCDGTFFVVQTSKVDPGTPGTPAFYRVESVTTN
ncbi:hypothetical protein VARIO8X_90065 [Burkholderiales bacterium 8X]|nr:hypothetical protein VARIO8X_90065 [Burkholderiales bacterium 8X]